MMRVTQQTISGQVIEGLQRAYQRVAKAQEIVTSGRRINHLSDDPIGAARALGLRSFEEALAQYQRNVDNSQPFLAQTDVVLGDVGSQVAAADAQFNFQQAVLTQTQARRESASGVNMDEEMTKLIQFQRAFESSALLIRTADEMYLSLIEMVRS